MVVGLMPKVKQPVLTAVCRRAPTLPSPASGGGLLIHCLPRHGARLLIHGVAALDPGGRAAVDVAHRRVAELQEVARRRQAPLPAVADGQDRSVAWHFVDS